ncbi:FliA/WhiG family RNA polymerase sigma factor [Vibrio sp. ZSDE26]|uniref:FliA/WhiG family RNA polymerase sigma factor n=1 Tax=Vibrio amylolyticus TaxID=2847292 RepID=A0A9X1XID2_9VIBR|nr:FliA/WhiG family RNA polymerase sigma factor [Vibrio amylolyticus]MCK6263341.1 FliA/WhiG family RNA polymerase sigma factor [Vibrio amylolyticus]
MLEAQDCSQHDYLEVQPTPSAIDEGAILRQHLKLVKRIVNQLRPHASATVGLDDMEQLGLLGLLEAARRYGEMDENFPYFASRRIRGAILDELRRRDWRPRQLRQQAHDLTNKVKLLTKKLSRQPSEQEILQELGLTSNEYHRLLYVSQAEELQSLEQLFEQGSEQFHLEPSDSAVQHLIDQDLLKYALGRLPDREQLILSLYYLKELSLKEIAMVVGLTEARICQLHKQALTHLQTMIKSQL